jgi:hypothetical protein
MREERNGRKNPMRRKVAMEKVEIYSQIRIYYLTTISV